MPEIRSVRSPGNGIDVVELQDVNRPQDGACKLCKVLLSKAGIECSGYLPGRSNPQVIINGGASRDKFATIKNNAICFK